MSLSPGMGLNFTAGTTTTGTGTSTITATPASTTTTGSLVFLVAYVTGADARLAKDAGDGWVVLDSYYDSVNGFGGLLAACRTSLSGSSGYAGLTLPANGTFLASTVTIFMQINGVDSPSANRHFLFDIWNARGSNGATGATASGTTTALPTLALAGTQCVVVYAGGHTSSNTTGSISAVTPSGAGYTEVIDAWNATRGQGLFLYARREVHLITHTANWTSIGNTTNKVGLGASVPFIANTNAGAARSRLSMGRRYG